VKENGVHMKNIMIKIAVAARSTMKKVTKSRELFVFTVFFGTI
jgi:hypothetical protein